MDKKGQITIIPIPMFMGGAGGGTPPPEWVIWMFWFCMIPLTGLLILAAIALFQPIGTATWFIHIMEYWFGINNFDFNIPLGFQLLNIIYRICLPFVILSGLGFITYIIKKAIFGGEKYGKI